MKNNKVEGKNPSKTHKNDTFWKKKSLAFKLAVMALLTAVSAVTNSYLVIRIGTDFRLTLSITIYFIIGIILGGPIGFVVGMLGDLLGWLLFVDGAYNPIIALTSGLFCLIPGVMWRATKQIRGGNQLLDIAITIGVGGIAYVICFGVCTFLLNSFGVWYYYTSGTTSFWAYAIGRAGAQLPVTLVNMGLSIFLLLIMQKIKYFKGFLS